MDDFDKERETRKQNRLERLGEFHPVCCVCGEDDDRCLEKHHVAGRQFGELLVIICRNCHRKLSDDQKDHAKKMGASAPSLLERLYHLISGIADFLVLLGQSLKSYAADLLALLLSTSQAEELQK